MTPQDAQASNAVVVGTLSVGYFDARVLYDLNASHSFMSPVFASKMGWQPSKLLVPLSIATPLKDELEKDIVFPSCPMLVEGRELLTDLVLLYVIDFDVILGMDWLAQHYDILDYREKEVIFRILEDVKF